MRENSLVRGRKARIKGVRREKATWRRRQKAENIRIVRNGSTVNLMQEKRKGEHETASSKTEGDRKEKLSGEPRSGPHLGESKQVCML